MTGALMLTGGEGGHAASRRHRFEIIPPGCAIGTQEKTEQSGLGDLSYLSGNQVWVAVCGLGSGTEFLSQAVSYFQELH